MKDEILVSICSLAYNQEAYIRQCLEGFIMQRTNFKFEVLINDDASTDKTADIIREYESMYPEIIKPIYQQKNQHSQGIAISATYLYPIAKGKYIAKCEGDDYWIDPLKLQKQVDFMENNKGYSMCFHNAFVFHDDVSPRIITGFNNLSNDMDISIDDVLSSWIVPTASMLVNKSVILSKEYEFAKIYSGDISLILKSLLCGKIRYIDGFMSVYRKHNIGHSISKNTPYIFVKQQQLILLESFNEVSNLKYKDAVDGAILWMKSEIRFHLIISKHQYWKLLGIFPFVIKKIYYKTVRRHFSYL